MKKLSCSFMGGLGNQLFQAALVISHSLDYNRIPVFTLNSYPNIRNNHVSNYRSNIFRKLVFVDDITNFDVVFEPDFGYTPIYPTENDTLYSGYFQSSKYFSNNLELIRTTFEPTQDFIENTHKKYPQILSLNTVGIHIRRGDYLNYPNIHPVVSKNYLEKSLNKLGDYSYMFVFTDDKKWVVENMSYDNMIIVNEIDYEEIWIMSMCSNNIISNSTFSWWGSFLNQNKDKKIFAPSVWFGQDGPKRWEDLYESNWTIINLECNNGLLI